MAWFSASRRGIFILQGGGYFRFTGGLAARFLKNALAESRSALGRACFRPMQV